MNPATSFFLLLQAAGRVATGKVAVTSAAKDLWWRVQALPSNLSAAAPGGANSPAAAPAPFTPAILAAVGVALGSALGPAAGVPAPAAAAAVAFVGLVVAQALDF